MAQVGRLTALRVARATAPGMYADGGGLYLQVTVNGRKGEPAKSWIYRYTLRGRAREMGLGSLSAISLQEARNRVSEYRRQRHDGVDPIEARRAQREQAILDAGRALTFKGDQQIYRGAQGGVAQRQACGSMGEHACYLHAPSDRRALSADDRHHTGAKGPRADLDD